MHIKIKLLSQCEVGRRDGKSFERTAPLMTFSPGNENSFLVRNQIMQFLYLEQNHIYYGLSTPSDCKDNFIVFLTRVDVGVLTATTPTTVVNGIVGIGFREWIDG